MFERQFIVGIGGELLDVTCFPPDPPGTIRPFIDYGDDYEDWWDEDDDPSDIDHEDQID